MQRQRGKRRRRDIKRATSDSPPARLAFAPAPEQTAQLEGRLEVRPIGTPRGLRELAALHKRTWSGLGVEEKRLQMVLWPLALHFGLYLVQRDRPPDERPPLIGAFWARALAEAPLTMGHLYPPALFRGLMAQDVFEFGGMVIDPNVQHRGLVKALADAARLFLFSRRPELIITTPVPPLYELYKGFGLKAVKDAPVEHPHFHGVQVYLMYGRFRKLAGPYFM